MEPYLKKETHKNYKVKTTVEILHINWFNIYLSLAKLETNLFLDLGPWALFLKAFTLENVSLQILFMPLLLLVEVGPRVPLK